MDTVPTPAHPLQNPGVRAALVRLGYALKDGAPVFGAVPPELFNDDYAVLAALSYIGVSAIGLLPPTMSVALIDETRTKLEAAVAARQDQKAA